MSLTYSNQLKKWFFKEKNNSVRSSSNFWKEFRNQNFAPKTSRIKILDEISNFKEHLKEKIIKAYESTVGSRKLQNIISKKKFLTSSLSFIRPYLDYGDLIYTTQSSFSIKRIFRLSSSQLQSFFSTWFFHSFSLRHFKLAFSVNFDKVMPGDILGVLSL